MFRPDRFSIAPFCLHVCLNLKMCAKTKKQFSIHPCASCAQCAPETPPEAADFVCACFDCTNRDRARTWDAKSNFDSDVRGQVMLSGQGTRTGGRVCEATLVGHEMVPRTDAVVLAAVRAGH